MFKEKHTLIENMAFMGIIAAINVICSLLSAFFPLASLFIMIFLPFLSAVVALICKWKYYPIYFFATLGVALGVTFFNTQSTLFTLMPSLITGFVFGFCFRKHLSSTYSLLFTSLVQLAISYALIPLINFIYNVDLINQFLVLFKLNDKQYASIMVPSFIYLISLIQMTFSYIVLNNELAKFKEINWSNNDLYLVIIGGVFSILVIPFIFAKLLSVAYLFIFIALLISTTIFIELIYSKKVWLIVLSSILFASGFLSIFIFYSLLKMPYCLTVINISNICIFITWLLYNLKREKKTC